MPEISREELEELRRLKLVEQSVVTGLKEAGFSDKALEFFGYKKNFLLDEDFLKRDADAIGGFTGACEDHVGIYLRIEENKIRDAKFVTYGCSGAVISAAALAEMAKNRNIDEAFKLNVSDVVEFLREGSKGLPKHVYDCCNIATGALKDVIARYKKLNE